MWLQIFMKKKDWTMCLMIKWSTDTLERFNNHDSSLEDEEQNGRSIKIINNDIGNRGNFK